jgi:eukaryotic-like serine/threonine-protein kinase
MPDLLQRLCQGLAERYQIEREIGWGGMAVVYRATDQRHLREVAVKVLRPGLLGVEGAARFLREVRFSARLTHPHILPLYDSGEVAGGPDEPPLLYYVMPYIAGESLRTRLQRDGQLPLDQAILTAREVAAALDYAHRQNVIHRDVKPENILLHEGGALVADFGVARAISDAGGDPVTEPGLAVGTPAYMSPEQASGERDLDGRSDQYSLACVLYEMLAGHPPFTGKSRSVMAQHVAEPPPPLRIARPEVPLAIEQVLLRALAKDPAARFPRVSAFSEALVTPLSGLSPQLRPRGADPAFRCIAVLPFVNASADPENEYLSDGITDELISALAQVPDFRVASRTSVFALKGRALDVRAIGALLEVETVLEGTVRKSGERLRITAQLSSVAGGSLLWSGRYDRKAEDVFAIQEDLARTIVQTLRGGVLGGGDLTPRRYTESIKAYSLYLKGRYAWNQRTAAALQEAIAFFESAIGEDPGFALAYSGLSDTYALAVDYRAAPVAGGLARARAEAEKALELDDTLAEAHTSLAWVLFIHDWDWEGAGRHFRRAIELNPRYATARQWYAWFLAAMARTTEAMAEARLAVDLDPASVSIRRSVGWLGYYAHEPGAGLEDLRRAVIMNPEANETFVILGICLILLGDFAEAERAIREALSLSPGDTHAVAVLGRLRMRQGRADDARALLRDLETLARSRYVSPSDVAKLQLAVGDYDAAFATMEQVLAERRGWLVYLRVDPALDPVRSDPRFARLVSRMGLD